MLTSVQRVKVMAGIAVALRSECRIERQMAAQLTMRNSWNKRISCGRRHHVFDVAPSRSEHRTVGGGLPAMNDYAIFLTHRVDCI
ncbi:hypothetical protein, partial [Pseudomonas viridiflava]|uniref:hypothetical protein n=1 Tax=Pseudomonas viridiflava TaxID=33069 RepID=UPI002EB517BE|nr:hypothetical protein [Pseudomonas viridiflava]